MNERFRMQHRSTRITLAKTLVLAQGLLLWAGCSGPVSNGSGALAGSMSATGNVGAAGKTGSLGGPTSVPAGASAGLGVGPSSAGTTGSAIPSVGGAAGAMSVASVTGSDGSAMAGAVPDGSTGTAGTGGDSGGASCLDGITTYDQDGPFKFMKEVMGKVNIWVPMVPAGCKVPIVHYANGTNSKCDPNFPILERLASHGFLTACYEDPNTGAGTQAIMAYDAVMMAHGDLVGNAIGSMGHSQGGQAAFIALQLAEQKYGDKMVYAGLAVEPASGYGTQPMGGTWQLIYGKVKSPMFMFSGTMDMYVSEGWVKQAYDAMAKTDEVYWWSAVGATHVPAPVKWQLEVVTPWFRWKLLGDKAACEAFKKLPDGNDWDTRMSENEKPCQ